MVVAGIPDDVDTLVIGPFERNGDIFILSEFGKGMSYINNGSQAIHQDWNMYNTSPLGAPNTGSWTKITANETGEVTLDVSLNTGSVDARLVGMVMNSDRTDIVSDNGWEVLRSGKG